MQELTRNSQLLCWILRILNTTSIVVWWHALGGSLCLKQLWKGDRWFRLAWSLYTSSYYAGTYSKQSASLLDIKNFEYQIVCCPMTCSWWVSLSETTLKGRQMIQVSLISIQFKLLCRDLLVTVSFFVGYFEFWIPDRLLSDDMLLVGLVVWNNSERETGDSG